MKLLRDSLKLNQATFAKSLGVAPSFISDIERGVKEPSRSLFEKLIEKYNVNINWLLGKEEQMISIGESSKPNSDQPKTDKGVPFYDIDVAAHIAEMFESDVAPSFFVDFEPFNDCTAYLPSYGDSMFPLIQSGDILAVKKLTNPDVILWGEAHLIITGPDANNLRTVKLVFQNEDPSKITLRASNPNFRGDTVVDKAAVLSIYIVKGIITRKQW
ncbi:MAG TPA: helix-turn-helix domain-containing protein [Rectinemataceae bacterium]|nr:helix-turn-helix domain-containing protein [Rectinemataceae bacterium]